MSRGVAVVTGAASGIGGATVPALTNAGFAVIGVDLAAAPDGTTAVDWVEGDVVRSETWTELTARCGRRDPRGATALVACAADVTVLPLLDTPVDEWRRLFDVNVIGVVMAMQALMPAMVERGSGAVAVTCSVNSLFVEDEVSAYSASKSALLSVTRSAALEHARHGLRINAVCPGVVDTPLLRKHLTSLDDPAAAELGLKRRMPTGAITRPEEVAAALAFLVTEEASGFSGSALVIDGGLTSTYDFVAD